MFKDAGRGAFLVVFGGTKCLGSGDSLLLRMAECPNRKCGFRDPLEVQVSSDQLSWTLDQKGKDIYTDWGSLVCQALSGSPPLILMTTRRGRRGRRYTLILLTEGGGQER